MIISSEDLEICKIPNWAKQLANLTKTAWTGTDGKCYFPYRPLTTETFWKESVYEQWLTSDMISWILVSKNGRILAHAALVQKDGFFELGRWVAYSDSPIGSITKLSKKAMAFAQRSLDRVKVETTQAHTSSQFICQQLGLRFAGIGFLDKIDGVHWDIIYYDNMDLAPFYPEPGILGNPLGRKVQFERKHQKRLQEISTILTTSKGGEMPPKKFHVLPEIFGPVSEIAKLNLDLVSVVEA